MDNINSILIQFQSDLHKR